MNESKIISQIKKELKAGQYEDLYTYQCDAGWQEWMQNFTEAEDGECISERESAEIEAIQERAFAEYEEEKTQEYIKETYKKLNGIKSWWNKNVKPKYRTTLSAEEFKNECFSEYVNTGSVEIRACYSKTGCPVNWI